MDAEPVVTSVTLSDLAILELGTGKPSLIGCFHMLHVPAFPATHPGFFATVTLTNFPIGKTSIVITVRIEDEKSGHVLASAERPTVVTLYFEAGIGTPVFLPRDVSMDLPIPIGKITFPAQAPYAVVVLGNNEELYRRKMFVRHAPVQPPAPPGAKA